MRLIFVRHPQTEANTKKLIYGRLDALYSKQGRATVPAIVRSLHDIEIDAIFASPLSRTRLLAEEIAADHGIAAARLRFDDRILEMNFGVLEGLTAEEARAQQGEVYQALLDHYEEYQIPEGESCLMVYARVKEFLTELYEEFESGAAQGKVAPWGEAEAVRRREKTVVVVSHSMVIHMALAWLLHQEPHEIWHIKLEPGAVADLDWRFDFAMLQGISGPLQVSAPVNC